MARKQRLDPAIFHLPVERMREGYYSDKYFVRARDLLLKDHHRPCVTMQVFGKTHAFLGGIDEAIAILRLCSMDWDEVQVYALFDGDEIAPWETVLLIEGPYDAFAHLETLYLGVLARRTKVGTNTRLVVEAAGPKQVMFFPARHDHWLVQTGDGYAAHIAGAIGVSTDAQASWWGSEGVGTVPHALIAAYGGDTCSRRRSSPSSWTGTCASSPSSTSRTTVSGRRSRWRARWASGSMACGSTRRRRSSTSR